MIRVVIDTNVIVSSLLASGPPKAVLDARMISQSIFLAEAVDEEDNRFLECAQASKANYPITGNLRHFPKFPLNWASPRSLN